ncbi:hypothetical protein GWI33_020050 [Rhynchophorus ferrugineus]|uniref:Uncharacterized protein n=1 Tax=Rhynchophorus ferrugineus TaxID=354439 RepID=A0A834HUV7_RHYFE|nr:hypothetical protein GWI33_020050 [Rhynchophorus ferrugineus]
MPKPLDIQSQKQIASLINYFERERENGGPLLPIKCVRERVADALHVSMGTVTKISQKVKNNITLDSPKKKRPHLKRVTNQDNLDIGSIRNTIFELYEKRKPTIKTDEQRYIILHAGNKNGFIPGAELLLEISLKKHTL